MPGEALLQCGLELRAHRGVGRRHPAYLQESLQLAVLFPAPLELIGQKPQPRDRAGDMPFLLRRRRDREKERKVRGIRLDELEPPFLELRKVLLLDEASDVSREIWVGRRHGQGILAREGRWIGRGGPAPDAPAPDLTPA